MFTFSHQKWTKTLALHELWEPTGMVVTSLLVFNCNSFRYKCMSNKFSGMSFDWPFSRGRTRLRHSISNDIRIGFVFQNSNSAHFGFTYLENFQRRHHIRSAIFQFVQRVLSIAVHAEYVSCAARQIHFRWNFVQQWFQTVDIAPGLEAIFNAREKWIAIAIEDQATCFPIR